jgi:arylsulfatase A-like enzyme
VAALACTQWPATPAADTGAAGARDLLPALLEAEVCPADGTACLSLRASARLHARPDEPGTVRLPAATTTNLYLRVPPHAALDLDVSCAASTLEIVARGDGDREVLQSAHPCGGDRRSLAIDLADVGGRISRVSIQVDAPMRDARGDGDVIVHRALLRSKVPPPPEPPDERQRATPRRPNVLIYVVDTLRADRLGCYGHDGRTSPRIDDLARSSAVFTHAIAQSSWTLPAAASILTGLLPGRHGAVNPERGLRPDVPTLAETLGAHGYETVAFVTNYLGSGVFGLDRGFGAFRFYRERGDRRRSVYLRSDALYAHMRRTLDGGLAEPFFLYVHATDPHFPYVPLRRYLRGAVAHVADPWAHDTLEAVRQFHNGRERWGARPVALTPSQTSVLLDLYDGEVRMADEYFGRLLDDLAQAGTLDRTLVVLTSDHGEEFTEHGGLGHGQTLYDEVVRVPLVIRPPGGLWPGFRADTIAQHVDIVPTVLDAIGLPVPDRFDGSPLALEPGHDAAPREAYASLRLGRFKLDAVIGDDWKVVRDLRAQRESRFRAYDTKADPAERTDRGAAASVMIGYARSRLVDLATTRPSGSPVPEDKLAPLRALGYVTGD